jgi:DNA modification methylase
MIARVSPTDRVDRLTEADVEMIASKLSRGEYLDDYLQPLLFRRPQEPELDYACKEPVSRILADTMAVPLQPLKRFADANGAWANKLIFGDNLQGLKTLLQMKERNELLNADGMPGIRMCYIDPPFATKREFRGSKSQPAYRDKVEGAEFIEFLRKRLIFIHELLADDGTLYVHLDPKKGHYIKVLLDEIFGSQNFRNEIIWWYYNKMQGNIGRFPSNHDCIYVYGKTSEAYFSPVMEERESVTQMIQRAWDSEKGKLVNVKGEDGKVLYIEREDRRVDDVWRLSMLQPADETEKVDYPTQKPRTLLEVAVAASTKPGDLVLDAFLGSGTTAVAAEAMDRRWIGMDCGKLAIYLGQRRLLELQDARPIAPFELCSAGLYDNGELEALAFSDFQSFCMELFTCSAKDFVVSGVRMAGTRKGDPVHLFPYSDTDAAMGRDYIESLHGRLKGKHAGPFYIVAPVSHCDPGLFEDVISIGRITFFVLRVPYSVIEVLHGRRFQAIEQPFSENQLNDWTEAFGFDFMQMPEVNTAYSRDGTVLRGTIASFMRGGLDPDDFGGLADAGREDLAMVMIDRDYQEDGHLRLSDHFFGDALAEADWTFALPLSTCGKTLLIVYVDAHGNERREAIEVASLTKSRRRRQTKSRPKLKT